MSLIFQHSLHASSEPAQELFLLHLGAQAPALCAEDPGELMKNALPRVLRSQLLGLHRTAVLQHDEYGQETLLNLLMRNYLHYNLYDQV